MNNEYYKRFCYLVNMLTRTLIILVCSFLLYALTDFSIPYLACGAIYGSIKILINGIIWSAMKELPLSDLGDKIFRYIYKLKFEDYIYSVEEVIHNDNTKEYYPAISVIKYYKPYYINKMNGKYYISINKPDIPYNSNSSALSVITEYKRQEENIRKNNYLKGVKEVNLLTFNFEKG